MTTKKVCCDLFLTHFSIKFSGSQTFFEKLCAPFSFECFPKIRNKTVHLSNCATTVLQTCVKHFVHSVPRNEHSAYYYYYYYVQQSLFLKNNKLFICFAVTERLL
jgi:hypothetical protein